MKKYCFVQDGSVIEGPKLLPECDANTSNLNTLDDQNLQLLGWLPVETVSENKPIIVSSSLQVKIDKVVETIVTRDKNQQEIAVDTEIQWNLVRDERNRRLTESDKYVMVDRWEQYDQTVKQSWASYRQQLRDIPQSFSSPDSVVYPQKP